MKKSIQNWNRLHSISMLIALSIMVSTDFIRMLPIILSASMIFFFVQNQHQKHLWSYANLVTLFRLGLILWASWHLGEWTDEKLRLFFGIALALDGLDGYLARKYKQTSEFGAYLDMETDAFFVAVLSAWWWLNDIAGWWILVIGFMRYIYVLIFMLIKFKGKEKSTRFAKTIAVIFMIGMLCPMVFSKDVSYWILLGVSILTAYSFGVSFVSVLRSASR